MSASSVTRRPREPVVFEAGAAACMAAALAIALVRFGPPGTDMAAHVYQRGLFLEHGFALWNNLWYSGRYSFVTYSVVYYPLAALVGISPLAVAAIATATAAFSVLVWRQWGVEGRWAGRAFAPIWAAAVLSAAFPFMLGVAFALLALCAAQRAAWARFLALLVLTVAASPVAFVLLAVVLAGCGLPGWDGRARGAVVAMGGIVAVEGLLWRMFPTGGRFPFSTPEFLAAATFCVIGLAATWRVPAARTLRLVFPIYFAACLVTLIVPSGLGENVCRLRYVAVPVAVLVLSLRRWRPLWLAPPVLALALAWNASPLVVGLINGQQDPSSARAYWQPAVGYLRVHLDDSYRVEVVDTVGHWGAVYLPEAGIPIVRGWFRQDDFPQNTLLYARPTGSSYRRWLRSLGVRYVVLTRAPVDYSARTEAAILRSGAAKLRPVLKTSTIEVFAVPAPHGIVSGPGSSSVMRLTPSEVALRLSEPGRYRVAVRFSPYWKAEGACVAGRPDGMTELVTRHAGAITLRFELTVNRALATLEGHPGKRCTPPAGLGEGDA